MDLFEQLCQQVSSITGLGEMDALAVAEALEDAGFDGSAAVPASVVHATAARAGFVSAD